MSDIQESEQTQTHQNFEKSEPKHPHELNPTQNGLSHPTSQVPESNHAEVEQQNHTIHHEPDANDLLQQAFEIRSRANKFVEDKEYSNALEQYKKALEVIRNEKFKKGTEEFKKMLDLKIILLNSVSLCYMNLQQYSEAIYYAEKVTLTDRENVKALYRIALCKQKAGEIQSAYDKIKEVVEIHKIRGMTLSKEINETFADLEVLVKKDPSNSQLVQKLPIEQPAPTGQKESNRLFRILFLLPTSVVSYMTVKAISKYQPKSKEIILSSSALTSLLYGIFVVKNGIWRATFIVSSGAFIGLLHMLNRKWV